jgi:hypothetical protein
MRIHQRLITQEAAQSVNLRLGPVGQIRQGALHGFTVFAPGFAQQNGELRFGTDSTYMAN